jgi:TolB-like protein/tetratricopeptide (TPR) repeat protein
MEALASIFDWLREQEAGFSAVAAILVIAGVVFAGFRWLVSRRPPPTTKPTTETTAEEDPLLALPTGPVVAVLPFENLSEDPKQEYFSDGLTDDIITALSRFKDLFVIARNSTFRYKGQAVDVRQLNKELGARYVLEGSVRKVEARLRVTAQLLDAKDGTHLWAETYDRNLSASNVFDIQDEITEQVVATLAGFHGVISRARFTEVKEKPTDSLDAYECVLRYGAYNRGGYAVTEHARLRDALEDAAKTDPSYAEAWACLSAIYLDEYLYDYNPRPDPLVRALEAARRGAAADPLNQFARFALAYVHFYRHDIDFFVAEGEAAIALNPNNAIVLHAFGDCLQHSGDERGIAFVRKALSLDPFYPTWYYFPIAHHHFERGEYQAALAAARRIELPDLSHTHLFLAAINAQLGRQEEAQTSVQELLRVSPGFNVRKLIEDRQKWNATDDSIRRWVAALRKAGLPE